MKKLEIEVSKEDFDVLEKRVKDKKEFKTVEEYVSDLIKQVTKRLRDETEEDDSYSKEDEEKVKERLRSLGYLD